MVGAGDGRGDRGREGGTTDGNLPTLAAHYERVESRLAQFVRDAIQANADRAA